MSNNVNGNSATLLSCTLTVLKIFKISGGLYSPKVPQEILILMIGYYISWVYYYLEKTNEVLKSNDRKLNLGGGHPLQIFNMPNLIST